MWQFIISQAKYVLCQLHIKSNQINIKYQILKDKSKSKMHAVLHCALKTAADSLDLYFQFE